MRITAAARRLGVSAFWLKELERRGVVDPIPRDLHGHRRLSEEDLEHLRRTLFPPREGRWTWRGGVGTATPGADRSMTTGRFAERAPDAHIADRQPA